MPDLKTYRKWLSRAELPLQALIDLLEGVEPSTRECGLLSKYKSLSDNQNQSPVSSFSEEECDGGLVEEFFEELVRSACNGGRSTRFLEIYALAEKSVISEELQASSEIGNSYLREIEEVIPPIYWLAPHTFIRWARSSGIIFPAELSEALPDYTIWPIMESWPLHAACSLVFDVAPPPLPDELSGNPKKLYELADNSRERLQVIEGRVKPPTFIAWALELKDCVPPELQDLVDRPPPQQAPDEIPPPPAGDEAHTGEPPAGQQNEVEEGGPSTVSLTELELHPDERKLLTALYKAGGPLRYKGMMEAACLNRSEVRRALDRLRNRHPPLVNRITDGRGSREGFGLTRDGELVARELIDRDPASNG